MPDLYSTTQTRIAIAPQAVADNTALVGSIIDGASRDDLLYQIAAGSLADADATFTVLVEHGDEANLSDAAAVEDEDLIGTEAAASFTFAADNTTRKIGYRGNKRYTRITITPAGNASNAFICVLALLGRGRKQPLA